MSFQQIYDDYVDVIKKAQAVDRAEAEIVSKFAIFVHDAFGVNAHDFIQEQTIRMAQIESSGRIDLLFGGLVLEFKKKLTRNTGARQLENYLRGLADKGQEYTGIFTDGLQFEIYTLTDEIYTQVDSFDLSDMPAETARLRLDAYLFSQHNTPPTAEDIVLRYGNSSPTFRKASLELRRLLGKVKDSPMLATWRVQWERLLSKVYGSNVADDELFIRHTYLSQFAKLLAYVALNNRLPDDSDTVKNIIKGDAFKSNGVNNIGEADFFSWILMDEIANDAVNLFNRLAQTFVVYNLSRIDQDLLKQLYQNLVDAKDRHDLGEYYTPDWLAELTLRDINYKAGQSLLDPTCGSGSFLFAAIKHLDKQGLKGWELVSFAIENIMGTDVHPLAVTIARINYLLALSEHLRQEDSSTSAQLVSIPVYMADALIEPLQNEGAGILTVPVAELKSNEVFNIPNETAQEARLLTKVVNLMEGLARTPKPDKSRFAEAVGKLHEENGITPAEMNLVQWANNLTLLKKLIEADRNGIWAYILKNSARPLMFAKRKFDVVVGNPPWLAYRYIKNSEYQAVVKSLYLYYELIQSNQHKLFTQMDLSTLFYALARDRYLNDGGTLAFVMPRSVITGAKQHRLFQKKGITRALDMCYVEPLFKVHTAVLIYDGTEAEETLPTD